MNTDTRTSVNENVLSQCKPPGNTKPGGKFQLYRWFGTIKAESILKSQLFQVLSEIAKEFYFQKERGEGENGYEHFQLCFSLKTKEYFSTVKNHFPNSIHLEPISDWFKSMKYCQKEETRIEGPWNQNSIFIADPLKDKNYYGWQKFIINFVLNKPTSIREIHWFWETIGNTGKTSFCKHLCINNPDFCYMTGSAEDMKYAIATMERKPKVILMDIARSQENFFSWRGLEEIKNGFFFSSKYKSTTIIFEPPIVICFANYKPSLDGNISEDRVIFHQIK